MKIIKRKISVEELNAIVASLFGDMVKGAVGIDQGILTLDLEPKPYFFRMVPRMCGFPAVIEAVELRMKRCAKKLQKQFQNGFSDECSVSGIDGGTVPANAVSRTNV